MADTLAEALALVLSRGPFAQKLQPPNEVDDSAMTPAMAEEYRRFVAKYPNAPQITIRSNPALEEFGLDGQHVDNGVVELNPRSMDPAYFERLLLHEIEHSQGGGEDRAKASEKGQEYNAAGGQIPLEALREALVGPPEPRSKLEYLEAWRKPVDARVTSSQDPMSFYASLIVPDAITTEINMRRGAGDVNPAVRAAPGTLGRASYFTAAILALAELDKRLGKDHPLVQKAMRAFTAGVQGQVIKDNSNVIFGGK